MILKHRSIGKFLLVISGMHKKAPLGSEAFFVCMPTEGSFPARNGF